ncbi:MAG: hypothetical protein ACI89L_001326 [Phycisphaerales bacterium]|jgi:hypothetical protein
MRNSFLFALAMLVFPLVALAQPISYQGQLDDNGAPADGLYDFLFLLMDGAPLGNQVGSTVILSGIQVTNGLFTTTLDFGPGAFDGSPRWIEIRVLDGSVYRILSPMQPVGNAPVAIASLDNEVSRDGSTLRMGTGADRLLLNRSTLVDPGEYFGINANVSSGAFGGMFVNTIAANGVPYYGLASGGFDRAMMYYDGFRPTPSLVLSFAGVDRFVISRDGEVEAANFIYSDPQTRYLSIPPEAFKPKTDGVPFISPDSRGRSALTSGAGSMVAPVYLPDGATVTSMTFYHVDDITSHELILDLRSRPLIEDLYYSFGSVSSLGNSPLPRSKTTSTFVPFAIDNSARCYSLTLYCGAWQGVNLTAVKGVTIGYTIDRP